MALVEPARPRSTISQDPDALRVVIPSRRQWFALVFLTVWLCFWVVGEVAVGGMVLGDLLHRGLGSLPGALLPGGFLLIWLTGWTIGGGFALFAWLWQVFGKEMVTLDGLRLGLRSDILGLHRTRLYDWQRVSDLRVSPVPYDPWRRGGNLQAWGLGAGTIAFDYGAKTYRFGGGVDEAEAKQIVNVMLGRYGKGQR